MTSHDLDLPPVVTITDQTGYLTVMRSLILTHKCALVLQNIVAAREVEAVYADLYEQGRANGWLNTDGSAPDQFVRELTSTPDSDEEATG